MRHTRRAVINVDYSHVQSNVSMFVALEIINKFESSYDSAHVVSAVRVYRSDTV